MRLFYLFLLGVFVAIFLLVRGWIDRKAKLALDKEIVRDGEEYLGSWGSKSEKSLILFRLYRDGRFSFKQVEYPGTDTIETKGSYEIIGIGEGRTVYYYPRLITFNEQHDTLFNYYIAYVTPYDTKVEKTDRMVLNPRSMYDTVGFTFFRIKQ